MTETVIELRRLEPEKGMKLTNGKEIAENEIYLGKYDFSENWHEITDAEAEKMFAPALEEELV